MNEFETFGFNIQQEGGEQTVSVLDNILSRLEKIQKLQNGGNGVKVSTKSTTNNSSQVINQATRKVTENSEELTGNLVEALDVMKGMTKEALSMQGAILSLNNAFIKLKDVEFKQDAIINNPNSSQNEIAEAIDKKTIANNNLQKALVNVAGAYTKLQVAEENASKTPLDKSIEKAKQKQVELNSAQTKTLYLIEESNKAKEKQIRQDARVALGLEEVSKKQDKTSKNLLTYGIRLTTIIALARKFARFTKEAIKESANYIENLNLFAVTFGENYKENAQWALDLANNLGLASSEAIRFTGLFKQLSTAIGNTAETGDEMSRVLTQFGYDLASFYNIDVTSAMEKLQAGIYSGQTKPLRSIGIDVTYQSIDNLLETNEALAQFNTSSKQLDQSQKAIARLIIALQSGSNAFGDMQRTIGTLANQIRVLEGSLVNFKLAVGDLVEEPLRNALIYINGFIQGITQVIRAIKPLQTETDTAVGKLGADAEFANEELAETEKKLAGFDKFNVLQTKSSTTDIDITRALTEELQKQISLYDEELAAIEEVATGVGEFAKKVKEFFIETDADGKFAGWTTQAKLLGIALGTLAVVIGTLGVGGIISKAISGIASLATAIGGANIVTVALMGALGFFITDALLSSLGEDARKTASNVMILVGAVTSLVFAALALKGVLQSPAALIGVVAGMGVAIAGVKNLLQVDGFAEGGYTNANVIMTHENGVREWVGRQGSSSAIVNDSQMSDIMRMAVARGVYEANMASEPTKASGSVIHNHIYLDGKEIYESVTDTAQRYGKKWANA